MQNDYDEVEIDISLSRVHTQRSETAKMENVNFQVTQEAIKIETN